MVVSALVGRGQYGHVFGTSLDLENEIEKNDQVKLSLPERNIVFFSSFIIRRILNIFFW